MKNEGGKDGDRGKRRKKSSNEWKNRKGKEYENRLST